MMRRGGSRAWSNCSMAGWPMSAVRWGHRRYCDSGAPRRDVPRRPEIQPGVAEAERPGCADLPAPRPPLPQVQQRYYGGIKPEVSAQFSVAGWGWHHEAGIHVLRLIMSGAFERFPKLQVISGHWGEMVPFYLQRLDDAMPPAVPACPPRQPKPTAITRGSPPAACST